MKQTNMTLTEIKKFLYKTKPVATFQYATRNELHYMTEDGQGGSIRFAVPIDDIGDAKFAREMESQLLNRWIQIN